MSTVTKDSIWSKEELNTFTTTDILMVVLLPPTVLPRLVRPPTRRSGFGGGQSSGGKGRIHSCSRDIRGTEGASLPCHPARLGVPAHIGRVPLNHSIFLGSGT